MVKIIPINCCSSSKSSASGWLESEHDHNGLFDDAGLRCYGLLLFLRYCIIFTSLICFLIMLYFCWASFVPCSGAIIIAARISLIRFADSSRFCNLYGCNCDWAIAFIRKLVIIKNIFYLGEGITCVSQFRNWFFVFLRRILLI